MAKQTYRGSCACGCVKFEASVDLQQGTSRCNCTKCVKRRWWAVRVALEDFRTLEGESELSQARLGSTPAHGPFCTRCGVIPYGFVPKQEWNDGAYVAVNVACLDGLSPAELAAVPIQYQDGRADNWWSAPAETSYL